MDPRGQRPPRSARPSQSNASPSYPSSPPDPVFRPTNQQQAPQARGISFQTDVRGERLQSSQIEQARQRAYAGYNAPQSPRSPEQGHAEQGGYVVVNVARKKSLVKPDREKIDPGHRQWHYRNHAAQIQEEGGGAIDFMPSATGNAPQRGVLRRGRSVLDREEDKHESGLTIFKRGATLRRRKSTPAGATNDPQPSKPKSRGCLGDIGPGPKDGWFIYCYLLTCFVPPPLLRACGITTPEQQRAWREKMGLLSIILVLMAGVGFLTFGFTEAVCGTPPNRYASGKIENGSVIIHGYDYDFSNFNHPGVGNFDGRTNPLYVGDWGAAGADISFMFQKVNQNCRTIITKAPNSTITGSNGNLNWYFPCNIYNQFGTSQANFTNYDIPTTCHAKASTRSQLDTMKPLGQVFYTWDQVRNPARNLAVFESTVLDLNLLQWLSKSQVNYPPLFDQLKTANDTFNGKDLSMFLMRTDQRTLGHCLQDVITVGFIDTNSIGCVASQVVLYISLVFIVGVVGIRFFMAVMFAWFFSWKIGNFSNETYEQRMQRARMIEDWSEDIYRPAPSQLRPTVHKNGLQKGVKKSSFLPSRSRFTPSENLIKGVGSRASSAYGILDPLPYKRGNTPSIYGASSSARSVSKLTPPDTPARQSRSSTYLAGSDRFADTPCPFPLQNVVPQPPADWEPFNYPLVHTLLLVTAYSESVEGLRTTLDSLATTDYPNSHKLILVIADGMVKGAGNTMTTPEICLSMMKSFVVPPDQVDPHSYVAIADGHKRHNMAKVYAGFYAYDDTTVERSKQQRVPMVLVAKCGNPLEADDPKPGNRGKRDSQIVLMAFLQKVMFDERMTTFEYEFFNSVWRVTGISPDRYELVLCVDADTKVFPDSLSRMVSCMVNDYEIMGLCGETKIANKGETWVTMIQVFEYYISHHMTKAFESMFGGVTCLPGCFSMYRIKAPKGDSGYWVPILANPDIVEHYSENVVDTLHKKNLLLLGEDRYLTTLMLKTFPKRKNIFCPQAVCKTVVPDTFSVLLSQRRRWINSTIHNLAELLLVRDLCGTFCFSMQFVVGMELAGTLVLPAAISFTIYLIVSSAIPGGPNTVIPLILLAIVLGLPGLLIVITSRKVAYIGWMLVYLLSLVIWNGILPAYAFWHFDDFSWGQTRQIAGVKDAKTHGDKEGEFDSTHIIMKRWVEFERERRWRGGTQSRDSATVSPRSRSPKWESRRHSTVSTSETFPQQQVDASTYESSPTAMSAPRSRHDSNQLLMLPAPLAVNRAPGSNPNASASTTVLSRSSEDGYTPSDIGSQRRLVSSPSQEMYFTDDGSGDHHHSGHGGGNGAAGTGRYTPQSPPGGVSFEARVSRTAVANSGVLRHSNSQAHYPTEVQYNPYSYEQPQVPFTSADSEEHMPQVSYGHGHSHSNNHSSMIHAQLRGRGVSLADNGPVPGPEGGVRRVSRQPNRRSQSQVSSPNPPILVSSPSPVPSNPNPAVPQSHAQTNRYSATRSSYPALPPGAAPPQGGGYSR